MQYDNRLSSTSRIGGFHTPGNRTGDLPGWLGMEDFEPPHGGTAFYVTETEKDRRAVRFVPRGDLKILDPIRTTAYIARNQDGMPCTHHCDQV